MIVWFNIGSMNAAPSIPITPALMPFNALAIYLLLRISAKYVNDPIMSSNAGRNIAISPTFSTNITR